MNAWAKIKEILKYKDLIWGLASNNLKAKYKNPALGFLWMFLVPFFMMLIYAFVFSKILKVRVVNYAFSMFLITGIVPWQFFSSSILSSTSCILDNGSLIKKVYFPREIIPISVILMNLITFLATLIVVLMLLPIFKIKYSFFIFTLPFLIAFETFFVLGLAFIFSSLYVRFRDLKYIIEILLLAWFYLSPIIYPLSLVVDMSETFFKIYTLNPFSGIISLYRVALLGGYEETLPSGLGPWNMFLIPIVSSIGFFLLGYWIFKKLEPVFSDNV